MITPCAITTPGAIVCPHCNGSYPGGLRCWDMGMADGITICLNCGQPFRYKPKEDT